MSQAIVPARFQKFSPSGAYPLKISLGSHLVPAGDGNVSRGLNGSVHTEKIAAVRRSD